MVMLGVCSFAGNEMSVLFPWKNIGARSLAKNLIRSRIVTLANLKLAIRPPTRYSPSEASLCSIALFWYENVLLNTSSTFINSPMVAPALIFS